MKLCECGCGRPAPIATMTNSKWGHVAGQPMRFVRGHAARKHGEGHDGGVYTSRSPEYVSWQHMKDRCLNPNSHAWRLYGGRGVRVCKRWRDSFESFLKDMGRRPSADHSLDRINPYGDYEPGNCRWADPVTQTRNRRT